jgi:YggT family protein
VGFGSGIAGFICFIVDSLFRLLSLAIIIQAILSWLFAFDVINYRNRFVAQLANVLDSVVGPVLAPLRRFIPPLGGVDITPIIALLILTGIQNYLLPPFCAALASLLGGGMGGM